MSKAKHEGPQVTLNIPVDERRILDLICTGLEQGCGYWAEGVAYSEESPYKLAEGVKARDFAKGGKHNLCEYMNACQHVALFPGCAFILEDRETKKRYELNREACLKGLEIMARDWPQHFSNWLSENDDAITGDVFIQCALLGDIVYG